MNRNDAPARVGQREQLRADRDSHACACAQAVATGDVATAVDWAGEYEAVCAGLAALVDSAPMDGGEL